MSDMSEKKPSRRDYIMNICLAAEQVVAQADGTGCSDDMTVTSSIAVKKLDKAVKMFYSSGAYNKKG
jgi:hypothetical protein